MSSTAPPEEDRVISPTAASSTSASSAAGRKNLLRTIALAVGGCAAAWVLPLLFHVLHVDWLSLLLIVVGTASILRSGINVLDRLMLTTVLLLGVFITAGLLFSVWPWGLNPVPVSGTLLSVLIVVAFATGRKPTLPRRILPSDVIALGAAAYAMYELYKPLRGKSVTNQLAYMAVSEDKASHFSLFDAIHRVGGYTYFHADQASTSMDPTMARVYPPGTHYLYTMLDTYLRSDTDSGGTLGEFHRYFLYTILGYGFLVLALVWAVRWVMGPTVTGWRRTLVCAAIGAMAATGQLITAFTSGHDSATLGLALLVLTVAVVVRPPAKVREYVLIVAAALVSLAFTYNLFVVLAAGAVVAATVVYWQRIRRAPVFTAIVAAITGAIVLIPIVGPQLSGFSQTKQLQAAGGIDPMSRNVIAFGLVVTLASLLTRAGRRSPVWRVMSAQLVLATIGVAAFGKYQEHTLGETSYYYEKAAQGLFVLALVGIGGAGLMLRSAVFAEIPGKGRLRRLNRALPAVAATVAGVVLAGGIQWGEVRANDNRQAADTTYLETWAGGHRVETFGNASRQVQKRHYLDTGRPTLYFFSDRGTSNWRVTFLDSILKRKLGTMMDTVFALQEISGVDSYKPGNADSEAQVRKIEDVVRKNKGPLRLMISAEPLYNHFRQFAARNPQLDLEVVNLYIN
jgi:hypothetical protein